MNPTLKLISGVSLIAVACASFGFIWTLADDLRMLVTPVLISAAGIHLLYQYWQTAGVAAGVAESPDERDQVSEHYRRCKEFHHNRGEQDAIDKLSEAERFVYRCEGLSVKEGE